MTLKELLAKRAALFQRGRAIFAAAEEQKRQQLTPEEETERLNIEGEIADVDKKIAFEEANEQSKTRVANLERSTGRVVGAGLDGPPSAGVTPKMQSLAIQAWLRANGSRDCDLSDEHLDACKAVGLKPNAKELRLSLMSDGGFGVVQQAFSGGPLQDSRNRATDAVARMNATAMSSHEIADGGATMQPTTLIANLELNMLAYGGILQAADILRPNSREPMKWPTANDTNNKAVRVGENQGTTQAKPTWSQILWALYKYTTAIMVPYELLDGSVFQLQPILGDMMGERIGRKWCDDFTIGRGGSEPAGIVTKAAAFTAGSSTAISWTGDIDNLISSVDPAYRIGAAFMMHDATRNYLAQLRDGNGRPLWAEGPNGTAPAMIKGYAWYLNQSMDSTIASGKKTLLFGRLKQYKVRQHPVIRILRLTEKYRDTDDADCFVVFAEADGNLLEAGTPPVKVLTHS